MKGESHGLIVRAWYGRFFKRQKHITNGPLRPTASAQERLNFDNVSPKENILLGKTGTGAPLGCLDSLHGYGYCLGSYLVLRLDCYDDRALRYRKRTNSVWKNQLPLPKLQQKKLPNDY